MTDVLGVLWDKELIGELARTGDAYGIEYEFRYSENAARAISVALPLRADTYAPAECRPFFEALLPEGTVRETLAAEFRLPLNDSFGLLRVLGRDCAGAVQILEERRMSETPDVHWLDEAALSKLIVDLPRRPLGIEPGGRMRLSLAGVQRKAVLVRDRSSGRFGEPLNGMPSTHLLKPEPVDGEYPGMAVNEYFCMLLAAAVGLPTAEVELLHDRRPPVPRRRALRPRPRRGPHPAHPSGGSLPSDRAHARLSSTRRPTGRGHRSRTSGTSRRERGDAQPEF